MFVNNLGLSVLKAQSLQEAAVKMAKRWATVAAFRSEWRSLVKNLIAGNYNPFIIRGVFFGDLATSSPSSGRKMYR